MHSRKFLCVVIDMTLPSYLGHEIFSTGRCAHEGGNTYRTWALADSNPLPADPAPWLVTPALQHDCVALQSIVDVVPGRCYELVLSLKSLHHLLHLVLN